MALPSEPDLLSDDALRELVRETAGETGEEFFAELVKHVARALGTKGAWVTEWDKESRHHAHSPYWIDDDDQGEYDSRDVKVR